MIPSKDKIYNLYVEKKLSSKEISKLLSCSTNKIDYWIKKYSIKKRSISESAYVKHNPNGDPFLNSIFDIDEKSFLYGLGLGLYWGEGNKANKNSVRLGNVNPQLILKFVEFLRIIYKVKKSDIRFGLQIFGDIDPDLAMNYWMKKLDVKRSQFMNKIIVSKVRGAGTYKNKSQYGVVALYFNNTKLRNIICEAIENL